jgi:Leucine-rich repeat (LRR) protein
VTKRVAASAILAEPEEQLNPPGMARLVTVQDSGTVSLSALSTTGYIAALWWDGSVQVFGSGSAGSDVTVSKSVPSSGNWSKSAPKEIFIWSCTAGNATQSGDLTGLDCWDTAITSLNVSGLTALTTLYCWGTAIASLNVSGLTALTTLYCNGCTAITSLNVSGCTALTTLYCNDCTAIASLNVSGLTALTAIGCFQCTSLTSLNVSGCTALTGLDCNGCTAIASLNVSGLTALTTLYCGGNTALTSLNVSGCTALTTLYCNDCTAITSLNVSGLTALTTLYCGGCTSLTSLRAVGVAPSGYGNASATTGYVNISVFNANLSAAALNQLYTDLGTVTYAATIGVAGNPGTASDDPTIATAKGYTVYGS